MKYVLIGAVTLWILYDVGSGVFMGLAKARQEELSSMPLPEMLSTIASSESRWIGSEWVDHGELVGASSARRTIVYSLRMTRKTKAEIDASWSKGWRSTMRHRLTRKACASTFSALSLSRGATVAYDCADKNGQAAFRFEVRKEDC